MLYKFEFKPVTSLLYAEDDAVYEGLLTLLPGDTGNALQIPDEKRTVALLVDLSLSMEDEPGKFTNAVSAVKGFIRKLAEFQVQVTVIGYSGRSTANRQPSLARTRAILSRYAKWDDPGDIFSETGEYGFFQTVLELTTVTNGNVNSIITEIENKLKVHRANGGGNTEFSHPVKAAIELLEKLQGIKAIALFTDGESTCDTSRDLAHMRRLCALMNELGMPLWVFAAGTNYRTKTVEEWVNLAGGYSYSKHVSGAATNLDDAFEQAATRIGLAAASDVSIRVTTRVGVVLGSVGRYTPTIVKVPFAPSSFELNVGILTGEGLSLGVTFTIPSAPKAGLIELAEVVIMEAGNEVATETITAEVVDDVEMYSQASPDASVSATLNTGNAVLFAQAALNATDDEMATQSKTMAQTLASMVPGHAGDQLRALIADLSAAGDDDRGRQANSDMMSFVADNGMATGVAIQGDDDR